MQFMKQNTNNLKLLDIEIDYLISDFVADFRTTPQYNRITLPDTNDIFYILIV